MQPAQWCMTSLHLIGHKCLTLYSNPLYIYAVAINNCTDALNCYRYNCTRVPCNWNMRHLHVARNGDFLANSIHCVPYVSGFLFAFSEQCRPLLESSPTMTSSRNLRKSFSVLLRSKYSKNPFWQYVVGTTSQRKLPANWSENRNRVPFAKNNFKRFLINFSGAKWRSSRFVVQRITQDVGAWVGELGSLDQHLGDDSLEGECQYTEIACPNLCGGRVQRRDLDGHNGSLCPKRQFTCTHCAYEATYQEITEDHWPKCNKKIKTLKM